MSQVSALIKLCKVKKLPNEVEDLIGYTIIRIEQDLILTVYPVKGEVYNPNVLPVVAELTTTAVYDACNFVGEHEFQILVRDEIRSWRLTCDENSSPMKRPSLILIAPIISAS